MIPLHLAFLILRGLAPGGTPAPVYAQATSGAAFLEVDPSPRSYAMGSAGAVTALGAQALGQNPANIGIMSQPYEAFASYETLLGGAEYEHAAIAASPAILPSVIDGLGFSITRWSISGLLGADTSGNSIGSFSSDKMALALGGSSHFSDRLRLGVDVKTVRSQIGSYSSNWALAGDLGAVYGIPYDNRQISLAFSADNLGQGLKFIAQTDPLPSSLQAAAAFPIQKAAIAVAQVRDYLYDNTYQASLGYEYSMDPIVFRIGYSYFFGNPSDLALSDQSGAEKVFGGLTAGLGLHWNSLQLDYAISQQAVGYGPTQRVAVTFAWGTPDQKKPVETPKRRAVKRPPAEFKSIESPW